VEIGLAPECVCQEDREVGTKPSTSLGNGLGFHDRRSFSATTKEGQLRPMKPSSVCKVVMDVDICLQSEYIAKVIY
jgi:hypothetical protein